ncbi:methylase [Pullulanibacillus camelliae]|uniref:Methylase n=1 Tax=Pullulanibacillus camelliae TaxID=1707096 RepID=A0A8J2VPD4_9BACL|nr:RsmB/NOP family class I SAM-dependent RNA methyltransferase [Pullulanibacillus camelliae]GGE34647.1 methylase [Pullulanibacillus camelliae]
MQLPRDFQIKMQDLLKEEYEAFIHSYDESKSQGLRVNTLKLSVETFLKESPFTLQQVPWTETGFYYEENSRPGKHPYHEAGLYYIQEPSAMAVGESVAPRPGEKVLDLCAAPGGKTTHLAAQMQQEGLLVSNEIHPMRARVLSQNVERMGIKNAVVTNETPERLAEHFPSFFDRILVDAPCSGEGMFRKDPEARAEWSLDNVARCSERQLAILNHAATMLRPGGKLVYSTCTFSPEENEGVIAAFIKAQHHFDIVEGPDYQGLSHGRPEWVAHAVPSLEKTRRIWPHLVKGEGHFIAVLRKGDGEQGQRLKPAEILKDHKLIKEYQSFVKASLNTIPKGQYALFGDQLYLVPDGMVSMKNLKVIRPGWHLGTLKKNRFEPAHACALALKNGEAKYTVNLSKDASEVVAYLRGETLNIDGAKGWYLVGVDGHALGWGKLSNNMLKNHYPKGLRWTGR